VSTPREAPESDGRNRARSGSLSSNVPRLLVRAEEMPDVLGISQDTFHKYVKPFVPIVRCGSLLLYRLADLDRWAEQNSERLLEGGR